MNYKGQQEAFNAILGSLNEGHTHLPVPSWISDIDYRRQKAPPCKQASRAIYRKLPTWMRLLPSNINADVQPPRHSVLERRLSLPYIEHTRYSTPFSTPTEFRKSSDVQAAELSEALQGLIRRSVSHEPHRRVPSSPQPPSAARKVKFHLPSPNSVMEVPTPDLVHSPETPASAPQSIHHWSPGPGTPRPPASMNDPLSHTIKSMPFNVPSSPEQKISFQRRLSKPIGFQKDSLSGPYRPASSHQSNDATSSVKPTS